MKLKKQHGHSMSTVNIQFFFPKTGFSDKNFRIEPACKKSENTQEKENTAYKHFLLF